VSGTDFAALSTYGDAVARLEVLMNRFNSLCFIHFVIAGSLPVVLSSCSSDQGHGPTVGAPSGPVVISEGGSGPSGGGASSAASGGVSSGISGDTSIGMSGTFNGAAGNSAFGGSDPFGVGGGGGGDAFGVGGRTGADPFGVGGSSPSFSGTAAF
jgi:hypothetical protein